jgi:hypothetical protein
MATSTIAPELKKLALDLNKAFPRSPRATLGGHVLIARSIDKCRAVLNGTAGEYHYNCPLDRIFFDATGIDAEALKDFVATGADDNAVGEWIKKHSKFQTPEEVVQWNNQWRYLTIDKMPVEKQVFFEGYIEQYTPNARIIYMFDIFDYEEKRLQEHYKV